MKRFGIWAVCVMAALCGSVTAQVYAQTTTPYRYTLPQGWQRAAADGMESFTTPQEPPDTVQVLLLPPKPLQGDFQSLFNGERLALEAGWVLSAPQAAPPQAGSVGAASYAAHYASYDSAGGARYMAFMALGQDGRFAMLVFVAASADAFNRQAPQAAALLRSLRFAQ